MPNSDDWPIKGPKLAWTPGGAALAVPLREGEKELTWEQYLDRLKVRVRWMSKAHRDPLAVLAEEWPGRPPAASPEALLDDLDFQDLLQERHDLSSGQFPRKVSHDPSLIEEMSVANNLQTWMQGIVIPLAD
jgi:hypothetical protein